MAVEIVMPKLGLTMEEGTIVRWRFDDGASVKPDDILFDITTDKLETEVAAAAEGVLRQVAPAGITARCGEVVGWILHEGEDLPPSSQGRPAHDDIPMMNHHEAIPAPAEPVVHPARLRSSPLARKLAQHAGLDLGAVVGTGPRGRIVASDVSAALEHRGKPRSLLPDSAPLSGARRVIAERMLSSLHEMAQLTLGMEVSMDRAMQMRDELIAAWADEDVRPSPTDLVVRAVGLALTRHPLLNAEVVEGARHVHRTVDIGVAVSLAEGLLVPVIRDVTGKTLRQISDEVRTLAQKARDGTLTLDELDHPTFTVTSLGAVGIDFFTPIINPPNVAILGVGGLKDGVVWEGDRPQRSRILTLSLTIDHRVIDGEPGALFLREVKELLESPFMLLS